MLAMASTLLLLLLCTGGALGCYQCLVDPSMSSRLCWGYVVTATGVRNMGRCFRKIDNIFNNNVRVVEAGRVGGGLVSRLKEILVGEIAPLAKEFENRRNMDTVYEQRLRAVAENFIAAASALPRASGCFPPCGFQSSGEVYNCVTCNYNTCEFPLDCPVDHMAVVSRGRVRLRCHTPFPLPDGVEIAWRFAQGVETNLVEQFTEVTLGADRVFSIPAASPHHQGTYQCEIFSKGRSIIRRYFFITVMPPATGKHLALQEVFDLALQPGGRLVPPSLRDRAYGPPVPPALLVFCLSGLLLLLFLSLGMVSWAVMDDRHKDEEDCADSGGGCESGNHEVEPSCCEMRINQEERVSITETSL